MANKQHNALTGASLHEPKGADTASVDTLYASNGSGSGTWRKVTKASMDTTSVKNVNLMYLTYKLVDISTAKSEWLVCIPAGKITKIASVIDGAITGANCALSFEIAGTAVTNGGITITQAGSAAGDVDTATPTANNVLTANQAIEIITDGGSTGAIDATLTFEIDVS